MEEYKETATKRVTYRLILDAIIKKEKIDAVQLVISLEGGAKGKKKKATTKKVKKKHVQ